ncbi:DNA replication complex GINS protein SLD5 [Phlebotomus argentipes]|uniref:DNA replication complex GINS protein SLD5 n=1 Tax=Phlebotomus argentipes TaxID=94469 RepID=UPI002893440E|nr:DNA replication complex GINS protein SLD5 [Phlebotomus argentipes]
MEDSEPLDQIGYESGEDEQPITAQKVLEILEKAWLNERLSPIILPHQTEMLDLMLSQLAYMEERIKQLDKNDFRSVAHRMELERIRYIIASYLRCRLSKIETFTQAIIKDEESRSQAEKRLSEEETVFAREYLSNMETHFQQLVLRHMPRSFPDDPRRRIVQPNLNSHVFIRAAENVDSVVLRDDEEEVDLEQGSQHIVPFNLVADLVVKGKVDLI